MIRDLNIRKVMKNAFRITKTKYKTALRVRVPGGLIDPECLMLVSEITSLGAFISISATHIEIKSAFPNLLSKASHFNE